MLILELGPNVKKYLGLFFAFLKASFVAELEYRINFFLRIVSDIFWYVAQIMTFEVLYRQTSYIGSWNLEQTRVFLGVLFVVDSLYMILLQENLERLSDKIAKGDLDLLLVKPVRSQFMISFQKVAVAHFGNLAIALAWLGWSLWTLPGIDWMKVLWLLILIPNGFLVFYAFRFSFAATAVIFTRSENLQFLWYNIYRLGTRPDSIYASWMKFIILSFIPVAMIASVPAHAVLDPPNWGLIVWSLFLGPFLVYLTTLYWKFCMRFYTSASS